VFTRRISTNVGSISYTTISPERFNIALNNFEDAKNHGTLLTVEDARLVKAKLCSRSDHQLLSDLGLITWASETTGLTQLACDRILFAFKNDLTRLDLSHLQLNKLPPVIFLTIFRFTSFNCSGNRLESIPNTFPQCSRLEILQCYDNLLTVFPDGIGNFSKLHTIGCQDNYLTKIPEDIGNCSALTSFNCSNNKLTELPFLLSHCPLEEFDFSNNRISEIPHTLGNCMTLKTLNCSRNSSLNTIPTLLQNLNDCTIDLSYTGFSRDVRDSDFIQQLRDQQNGPEFIFEELYEEEEEEDLDYENEAPLYPLLEQFYISIKTAIPYQIEALFTNTTDPITKRIVDHEKNLCSWINRISWITNELKKRNQTDDHKIQFFKIVDKIIQLAISNLDFRALFQTILEEASSTCGDRVILSIIHLHIAEQLLNLDKNNLHALASFLKRGGLAIELIAQLAEDKIVELKRILAEKKERGEIDENEEVEEVEVYLALYVSLQESFDLPIGIKDMLFFTSSDFTKNDIENAKALISQQLTDEAVIKYISQHATWQAVLQKKFPDEMAEIHRKAAEEMIDPSPDYIKLTQIALESTESPAKKRRIE